MKAKALTITYLTKASYASLNGADKEADNIVSIKKIQKNDGMEYPYCSSQAVRRALKNSCRPGMGTFRDLGGETEKGGCIYPVQSTGVY